MRGKICLEVFPVVRVWSQTTLQANQSEPWKNYPWFPPLKETKSHAFCSVGTRKTGTTVYERQRLLPSACPNTEWSWTVGV